MLAKTSRVVHATHEFPPRTGLHELKREEAVNYSPRSNPDGLGLNFARRFGINVGMSLPTQLFSRREFVACLAQAGIAASFAGNALAQPAAGARPDLVIQFPAQWSFLLPKGGIILVSDQQLDDLTDPDKEVDLSLSSTPNKTTLRKICEQNKAGGVKTMIVAFDEFWSAYRAGQGGKPRAFTPDVPEYLERIKKISDFAGQFGIGLELSLLSPLELGRAYQKKTGESGRWVQYREGWRDPKTGEFTVQLWEQRQWTNNKGTINLTRTGVRLFAYRERRIGNTDFYAVDPKAIVELKSPPQVSVSESASGSSPAHRLTVHGSGETEIADLDRVLVVVSYQTPEMDYFSPKALPYLKELVQDYHTAGVHLNGLYSDEIHIQGDWNYFGHHDEGEFTLRYLTPNFAKQFAALYGAEFADFEKYLVYFCRGQHGFLPNLDARALAQHVLGNTPDDVQRTWLLRRRYYDLLEKTVADLFVQAKQFAEKLYGHELEARAHATWAQSPTIDLWRAGGSPPAPRQYDYTPNFVWSNTVQQAACACSDYFRWNEFLTGAGNDHAEGGWSDRDYYGLALACSTGILNKYPNSYAAAWGMPNAALARHHALEDAFGAWGRPQFMAVTEGAHRDIEVLMLYPISLVAADERFGSWMVQYGYANYVTPEKLLQYGHVNDNGTITMAGRTFSTLAALFEPLPPVGLIEFLEQFVARGGRLIWSGPLPRFDLAGADVRTRWQALCGVKRYDVAHQGLIAAGARAEFAGPLKEVPVQTILTDFIVDWIYPVDPADGVEVVARAYGRTVGLHRKCGDSGSVTYLGFRPRDDQSASLGYEARTWFEILSAVGAYAPARGGLKNNDNPSTVSRWLPWLATRFPNGTTIVAMHYRSHVESWPGGFHRDEKRDTEIIQQNPLPADALELRDLDVNGHHVNYRGRLIVAFRLDANQRLVAFSGYDCAAITVDGHEHRFTDQPFATIGWAPVPANRRVPGGAILEVWIQGEGEVRIPLVEPARSPALFFAHGRAGALAEAIPCAAKDSVLRFTAKAGWGLRKLFLLPA